MGKKYFWQMKKQKNFYNLFSQKLKTSYKLIKKKIFTGYDKVQVILERSKTRQIFLNDTVGNKI